MIFTKIIPCPYIKKPSLVKRVTPISRKGRLFVLVPSDYWSRLSTELLLWFACASMDCAACVRMLFFVKEVISFAISASLIVYCDAVTFSLTVTMFAFV